MSVKTSNFRVILALKTLPQDTNLDGASLRITISDSTKTIPLVSKEANPLDFTGIPLGGKLEFGLEDFEGSMFGYSELKIPSAAFEKNETMINEHIRFFLLNKQKDSLILSIHIIFLNKSIISEKSRLKGSQNASESTPTKLNTKERIIIKSPSSSAVRRSVSKGKTTPEVVSSV